MGNNKTTFINHKSLSSDGATLSKVIATFSVVLTHSYKLFGYLGLEETDIPYLRGIHAFAACGVPVFFLLSGYFLTFKDNWNWKDNLKKKTKSLLVPYLVFTVLYAFINCVGYVFLPNFFDDFKSFTLKEWIINLFGIPFVEGPHFYGPLWFVRDLIIFNLLAVILVPLVKKLPGYILIPLLSILYFLPISQFIRYPIVFFILGMYFGCKKCIPLPGNYAFISVVFLLGAVLPIIFLDALTWKISVLMMTIFVLSISERLIGRESVVSLSKKLIPYSFPVYLLHEYPMTVSIRLIAMKRLPLYFDLIVFVIAPFVIIALCILISFVWKKISSKSFSFVFGGR